MNGAVRKREGCLPVSMPMIDNAADVFAKFFIVKYRAMTVYILARKLPPTCWCYKKSRVTININT